MSDSAGGGEGGGAAGAGQDAEADNEPPHQAPPLPGGDSIEVGETSEEGAPPSAKRPRMSEEEDQEEQGLDLAATPVKMHGETTAQDDLLQEDAAPPAQSTAFLVACLTINIRKVEKNICSCNITFWDCDTGLSLRLLM